MAQYIIISCSFQVERHDKDEIGCQKKELL